MKVVILFFILFISSFIAQAQSYYTTSEDGRAKFEAIIETKGEKDKLFLKGKEWIYKTYKSGDAVINVDDKEQGRIFGKGKGKDLFIREFGQKNDFGHFKYNITIDFKDNKARIIIDEITQHAGGLLGMKDGADYSESFPSTWLKVAMKANQKRWDTIKADAASEFNGIIESFKMEIAKENKSDW